jgi:DNA repair protein RadC
MTAAQKANQQRFKKVVAEAKKLRAKDKKLTQAQAVKKAWAMIKGVKKENITNVVKKKTVTGWRKGKTAFLEKGEGKLKSYKNIKVARVPKGSMFKAGTFSNFSTLSGYQTQPEVILGKIGDVKKLDDLIPEIKVRITRGKKVDKTQINSSAVAADIFKKFIGTNKIQTQEFFALMFMTNNNNAIGVYILSMGGITATIADPRLIFGSALKLGATGFIICHNHPSGNLQPSDADKKITQKLIDGAKVFDINVVDHIIITKESYFSFRENGIF